VNARWTATGYVVPEVVEAGPAPVELPEIVAPGGSGLPLVAGQFLKKRPFDGWEPEQMKALVGVSRKTVMLETVRFPVFLSAICHVPVPSATVTLSETICTPSMDAPAEDVDDELVPVAGGAVEELET
jgi:hypothetical protein